MFVINALSIIGELLRVNNIVLTFLLIMRIRRYFKAIGFNIAG